MLGNEPSSISGLADFADRFVGYGHLSASVWFFALGEGGGADLAEIPHRVKVKE